MPRSAERTDPVLHNRLAVLRAERGLSRQELADGLGVNYQTIGYLERGEYNPSLELALRAAEFFGLPVEAIFSRAVLLLELCEGQHRGGVHRPLSSTRSRAHPRP